MLEAATLFFFPALVVFAAFSDLLTMTISNRVSAALAILFFAMALASGLNAADISWHLASGAAMLVLGFGLFARGWVGGGDAKLAAAAALWLGFDQLGQYAIFASALGGLLTLAILGLRNWPLAPFLTAPEWIARLYDPGNGVPYGIALSAAALILYPQSAIWLAAVKLS
ncbi:MAG: prepilin peptidase [Beijerinckiaceae bacterium]|nr:prepilin peptidase [Beijerinckiaceae bacterium]